VLTCIRLPDVWLTYPKWVFKYIYAFLHGIDEEIVDLNMRRAEPPGKCCSFIKQTNAIMRTILLTLFLFFCLASVNGQQIKPYLAVVKTTAGKYKGVLQKVDTGRVMILNPSGLVTIAAKDIEYVKIRVLKRGYVVKDYFANVKTKEEYHLDRNGRMVDKWGHEAPTVNEEVSTSILTVFFMGLVNVIALPIHAINPNLTQFSIQRDTTKYREQLQELSYYSIYYQNNPDTRNELLRLRFAEPGM
jgi:hypothetical protein